MESKWRLGWIAYGALPGPGIGGSQLGFPHLGIRMPQPYPGYVEHWIASSPGTETYGLLFITHMSKFAAYGYLRLFVGPD